MPLKFNLKVHLELGLDRALAVAKLNSPLQLGFSIDLQNRHCKQWLHRNQALGNRDKKLGLSLS